jgi:hypothetical protein
MKPSSSLKASEIEALTFIYSPVAKATARQRSDWWHQAFRGHALAFCVTVSLGMLVALAWVMLPH